MAQRAKPAETRELEPGLHMLHIPPRSRAATDRSVNGSVDHAREVAVAIRQVVAQRRS